MKADKICLCTYRSLYWANQGLLQAVRSLEELRSDPSSPAPAMLDEKLRRTQAMIEETRLLMNQNLVEWVDAKE